MDYNYTEFIEELYGAPKRDVCYIHGCRRKKKGHQAEKLTNGALIASKAVRNAENQRYEGKDLTDRQRLIMVANYAAFYSGNFIASLNVLEVMLVERGIKVSYVFPKNALFANCGEDSRYLELHDVHTADFTPAALAAELKS